MAYNISLFGKTYDGLPASKVAVDFDDSGLDKVNTTNRLSFADKLFAFFQFDIFSVEVDLPKPLL